MNLKLFISREQLNWSEPGVGGVCMWGGGAWLAANAQSRTSTLIAWNVNTENQLVC